MRVKNESKSIRYIAKTLGMSKSTVRYIVRNKNALVSSAIANELVDHGRPL